MKPKLTKYHLLTIASIGLFIGFWLGFLVFVQVRLKIVCQPSGKVLLDTSRSLRKELTLNVNVIGCESIDLLIRKPTLSELIFGKEKAEREGIGNKTEVRTIPSPPEETKKVKEKEEEKISAGYVGYEKSEPTNASVTLTLEIFDACSPRISSYSKLIEGTEWCANEKYPYNLIIRRNETHVKVSLYGESYSETYRFEDNTPILRLFAQDVTTVKGDILSVGVYGDMDKYFSVGEYSVENVWERDPETGVLKLTKTVLSFPLIVSKYVPYAGNWSELRFYLNLTQGVYFIGNSYVYVTSM